jgi:hypothetical protein
MKTTQKRNMGFSRTLFLMVMLSLVAVFGLAAGGAPAGAGVTAATPTRAPAATGAYAQATLLAAFNAATSPAQVKALLTKANFDLLDLGGGPGSSFAMYELLGEGAPDILADVVYDDGSNYATVAALKAAIKSAIERMFF